MCVYTFVITHVCVSGWVGVPFHHVLIVQSIQMHSMAHRSSKLILRDIQHVLNRKTTSSLHLGVSQTFGCFSHILKNHHLWVSSAIRCRLFFPNGCLPKLDATMAHPTAPPKKMHRSGRNTKICNPQLIAGEVIQLCCQMLPESNHDNGNANHLVISQLWVAHCGNNRFMSI